jgi:GT2 family glycosyltransferase
MQNIRAGGAQMPDYDMNEKQNISDELYSLVEAGYKLLEYEKNEQWESFSELAAGMKERCDDVLCSIVGKKEKVYEILALTAENCSVSLERIIEYASENRELAQKKTEFELIPLLRTAHVQFYYNALVAEDKELMDAWVNGEGEKLCENKYAKEAERTGQYKYDLSILVLGYNNLDYTKMCIDSILYNLPKEATYELIFVNHGSSDGTKEYFESKHPDKQMDLKNNGGGLASYFMVYEGKVAMFISNDVIVTPNTFDIIYHAFERDEKMGMATPMTSNITNMQIPDVNGYSLKYENVGQLFELTSQHNKENKYIEETRLRLCTPLWATRSKFMTTLATQWNYLGMEQMFSDDYMSMVIRREGYKNVLMQDIYCHHFGSVTIKNEGYTIEHYANARKKYLDKFGIDPWGKGFAWDYTLFTTLVCDKEDAHRVLGINCGMGSDPIKIQQELKKYTKHDNVELTIFSNRERDMAELAVCADFSAFHKEWNGVFSHMEGSFDYIIVEDGLSCGDDVENVIKRLYDAVTEGGKLILFLTDREKSIEQYVMEQYRDDVINVQTDGLIPEIDDANPPQSGRFLIISR